MGGGLLLLLLLLLLALALNGTSLLAMTCPCKNQAGWPFWCPYRNVVFFSIEPCTGETNSEKPQVKIRFAFHFVERKYTPGSYM